eukprot:424097-Pelagomonas_calceolata.AAC.2
MTPWAEAPYTSYFLTARKAGIARGMLAREPVLATCGQPWPFLFALYERNHETLDECSCKQPKHSSKALLKAPCDVVMPPTNEGVQGNKQKGYNPVSRPIRQDAVMPPTNEETTRG